MNSKPYLIAHAPTNFLMWYQNKKIKPLLVTRQSPHSHSLMHAPAN